MMRFWLSSHNSPSIREQLSAQFILGILSGRLAAGERLPSIRGLAARLRIHQNTVTAVYRDLATRGWVHTRPGSGVFVEFRQPMADGLTAFVAEWLEAGERRGFTRQAMALELEKRNRPATESGHFLVVDPDGELARIIAAEIGAALQKTVVWSDTSSIAETLQRDSRVLINAGHIRQVASVLGSHPYVPIRLKSMQDVVLGHTRPEVPVLVAVVSRSSTVLAWAGTLLSALGFSSKCVLLRNPETSGWQEGVGACDIVAADVCAVAELAGMFRPVVFRIVADDSLAALRGGV